MHSEPNQLDDFIIEYEPVPYSKKFLSRIIDAMMVFGIYFAIRYFFLGFPAYSFNNYLTIWLILLLLIGYRLITVLAFSGTPGMLLLNTRFLNSRYKKPTIIERLLAAIFVLINDVDHYTKTV